MKGDQTSVCLISKNALGSVKDGSGQIWRERLTLAYAKKTLLQMEGKVIQYTMSAVGQF